MRDKFKKRRDFIIDQLNTINGINCSTPGGAFYAFPSFDELVKTKKISNVSDFCLQLLKEKSVVSVPGASFGSDNNIRFSYAISSERINLAIQRIRELLN